jgi:nucleoid DNA-binding protein
MTLTKDPIVGAVAEANGYSRNQAVDLVENLLELIKSELVSGEDVLISKFGKILYLEETGEARTKSGDSGCYDAGPKAGCAV